jgi:NADH:ubiquinone oxidoreductase subunit K
MMTISDPMFLGPLIVGAALFGLGSIGYVARKSRWISVACWGVMVLGALVTLFAGTSESTSSGRNVLALAAIVVALCESGLAIIAADRSPTDSKADSEPSVPSELRNE